MGYISFIGFTKKKQAIFHILGWLVFIAYEVSFVTLIRRDKADVSLLVGYIFPYCINISLFYFHSLVIMPFGWGKEQRNILSFFLLVIVELLIYLLFMGFVGWSFLITKEGFFTSLYPTRIKFIQQLWRGIYFLIFGTAYWLIQKSFSNEQKLKEAETTALLKQQEKKELELKLISTQNAFLQTQINPHLLFNTLSFIHSEVQQVSTKASDALIVLSEMMRYSLSGTKADGKVLLGQEIEQIENLIKLNQFRFNDQLCIELKKTGDFDHLQIIPLLLLPFVENLFKYADLTDRNHTVKIHIQLIGSTLHFKTKNKKRTATSIKSHQIGIENVKKRLNTYYFNNFTLDINDLPTSFLVDLKLDL